MANPKSNGGRQPEKSTEKSIDKNDNNYKEKMNQKHANKKPKGKK